MRNATIGTSLLILIAAPAAGDSGPVWPPPPDEPRVRYVDSIDCGSLSLRTGWLKRIVRVVGGGSDAEEPSLPFDVAVRDGTLYLTCQNLPALVEVDLADESYRLHRCDDRPLEQPIGLAAAERTTASALAASASDGRNGRIR